MPMSARRRPRDLREFTVGMDDAGTPYPVTRAKLVSLIGTFAAGLHQGQRKWFPPKGPDL
jgi:hypothetical protein